MCIRDSVKTVPSGDFKEHFSRDPFPVQEFLFLFIEQPLMLLFLHSALFRLFLLLLPAFLLLYSFIFLTGLHQGSGVKSESLEHADGDQIDEGSSFRTLKRIRNPVPAIGGGFLSATFSLVLGNAEQTRLEELPLERFNVEEIPLEGEVVEEHAGFTDVFFYTDLTNPYAGYVLNLQKLKAYNRLMFPLAMALNREL